MSNNATIKVTLSVDKRGSVRVLQDVGKESAATGKKGKQAFNDMDQSAKGFTNSAKMSANTLLKMGAAVVGIIGIAKAWGALKSAAKEYLALASEQESAERTLGAVLKATGEAAGYNLEQLKDMASGLQDVTRFGDETTLAGMAILATFKQVRGEAFERATVAAMDMSVVLKTDLKSGMIQIGKALQDPAVGLTSLSRAGVTFTDSQKDVIKSLQESGNMVAAQNIILSELESQFGGAAKAAAEDFAGGVEQAKNALGDAKEEMGFVITKNQFFIELAHMATEEFKRLGVAIKNNNGYLMAMAKDGIMSVNTSLSYLIDTGTVFSRTFELAGKTIAVMLLGLERSAWQLSNVLVNGPIDTLQAIIDLYNMIPTLPDIKLPQGMLNYGDNIKASLDASSMAVEAGVKDIWELLNRPMPGNYLRELGDKFGKIPVALAEESQDIKAKPLSDLGDTGSKNSDKELKVLQEHNRKKYAMAIALANKMADDSWLIREAGLEKSLKGAEDAQTRLTQLEYDEAEKRKKSGESVAESWKNAFDGWANDYSHGLTQMITESGSSFREITGEYVKMLGEMYLQKQAIEPMLGFGSGLLGKGFGMLADSLFGGVNLGGGVAAGAKLLSNGAIANPSGVVYRMAGGGVINEHIIGTGLSSGASYEFGEGGVPEVLLSSKDIGKGSTGSASDPEPKSITNVYIQAADSKSFFDMIKRNPGAMEMSVNRLLTGNSGLRKRMQGVL